MEIASRKCIARSICATDETLRHGDRTLYVKLTVRTYTHRAVFRVKDNARPHAFS